MNYKNLYFLVVFVFCNILTAQVDSVYTNMDSIYIQKLEERLALLESFSNTNSKTLNGLLSGKELEDKDKYELVKSNLLDAFNSYSLLSEKIIDLKSLYAQQDLDAFVKELNNPESDILGFTFNKKIKDLVLQHIQPKKKSLFARLFSMIESVTKSPVLSNLAGVSPALNVANSVLGIVRSVGIMDDRIDLAKIQAFEKDLGKYVAFYHQMHVANQNLIFGIDKQNESLEVLQKNTKEQIEYLIKSFNLNLSQSQKDNESNSTYLNRLFAEISKEKLQIYFTTIERDNIDRRGRVNYTNALRQITDIKEVNNRLGELIESINSLEMLYKEYFENMESYNKNIEKALTLSETSGIAKKDKVKEIKELLISKKDETIIKIKESVNFEELTKSKNQVKYSAKVM